MLTRKRIGLFGILAGVAVIGLLVTYTTQISAQQLCDFSGTAQPVIKGNVSDSGLIYHVPGESSYEKTHIDEFNGERWFCTEQEAVNAGWRPTEYRASRGGVPEPEPAPEPQPLICDFSGNTQLLIKGNVSSNGLIYHVPGDSSYSVTSIELEKGERWFCQERQALHMNWRPTQQRFNRAFSRTLQQGYLGPEVKYLQVVLNWLGFEVAHEGPGSPGNETNEFGPLTKDILGTFQQKHVPTRLFPDGVLGPLTRAKLAQLLRVTPDPAAPINEVYECVGGKSSWLGSATSGPYTEAATGKPRQDFQKGYIGWDGIQQYAFNTRSIYDRFLAPVKPICVYPWIQGTNERIIAESYNRIGGQLTNLSTQNSMDTAVPLGVWSVESAREGPFGGPLLDGKPQPTIRVETHWICWNLYGQSVCASNDAKQAEFRKYFNYNPLNSNAQRVCWSGNCPTGGPFDQTNGWYPFHGDQTQEYNVRDFAIQKLTGGDATKMELVYQSISMGGPQIMGFNYVDLENSSGARYASATEMFNAFSQSEFSHVKGFFDYMKNHTTCKRRLDDSRLCQIDSEGKKIWVVPIQFAHVGQEDWYQFTAVYNGNADKQSLYEGRYRLAQDVLGTQQ